MSTQKVSLNRIIGNVVGNLGIKNVNDSIDDFARWAVDAEMKIGARGSYEHFECELEIKNYRACLPDNFIFLNALKYGAETIDVTKRDFRLFSNAPKAEPHVDSPGYDSGNRILSNPGQVLSKRITLTGVFAAGSTIVITIASNNCSNLASNSFTYLVQLGDTLSTIATNIAAEINAIFNLGYTAVASGANIDITADNVGVTFNITTYTDAVLGGFLQTTLQAHVAPRNYDPLNAQDNCDVNPNEGSPNLSSLNAYDINTGTTRSSNMSVFNSWGYQLGPIANAKVFAIENGYVYVNFVENGRVGISYDGVALDEEGWPLIDQLHEDAVTQYLMYKFKAKEFYAGKLPHYVYKELENRWFWLCGQARGQSTLPNKQEMEYLSSMWNQMLPLPSKNYF